jgi:hypothetical protein
MTPYTGPRPTRPFRLDPMPFGPLPPSFRRARRRTALLLGVVAVVLFLVAGAFAGLYVMANGQRDAATVQLDDRRGELSGLDGQRGATEQARDEATRRNAELESTRAELAECVEAVRHYLWDDLTSADQNTALDQMFALCQ